jgi:CheY-like chemotaxis protein
MPSIRLIHWKPEQTQAHLSKLQTAGYEVEVLGDDGSAILRDLKRSPPDAILIDLTRMPSHGRDVALALRSAAATRQVPLIFVEGTDEIVQRLRKVLPDASYCRWSQIRSTLRRAMRQPLVDPLVPSSRLEGYSGTPLPKKLGIKAETSLALINAPNDFEQTLGALPPSVVIRRRAVGNCDLALWFVTSCRELYAKIDRMGTLATGLWIIWPKKASEMKTDLTQAIVRETALAAGLVDYKVCAVDATWSGLKFARRKPSP